MSDVSRGLGWWLASDGKFYPPHLHADYVAPPPPPAEALAVEYQQPASQSATDTTTNTCVSGHGMEAGDAFCATCGSPRATTGGAAAPEHPVAGTVDDSGRSKSRSRFRWRRVVVVFIVAACVAVGILIPTVFAHHSHSTPKASPTVTTTPGGVCFNKLDAWVVYALAHRTRLTITEAFGTESGIPTVIAEAVNDAQIASLSNGYAAARKKLGTTLIADCTTLLAKGDNPTTWPTPT